MMTAQRHKGKVLPLRLQDYFISFSPQCIDSVLDIPYFCDRQGDEVLLQFVPDLKKEGEKMSFEFYRSSSCLCFHHGKFKL